MNFKKIEKINLSVKGLIPIKIKIQIKTILPFQIDGQFPTYISKINDG
jgi:hypothetical protein